MVLVLISNKKYLTGFLTSLDHLRREQFYFFEIQKFSLGSFWGEGLRSFDSRMHVGMTSSEKHLLKTYDRNSAMKQMSMSFLKNYKKEFGGQLLIGKRKGRRPLSTKHPIHLVLRSELSGVFNPGNRSLERLLRKTAEKFHIKIYDFALNWSHIHLVIRIRDRKDYVGFIRVITSLLVQHLGKKRIFTLRPFTRVMSWGKDFQTALSYQVLNQLEALGFVSRKSKAQKRAFN